MTIDPVRLNRMMQRARLSIGTLASLAAIPEHRCRRILTGHLAPSPDDLEAMAGALGCAVADIIPVHSTTSE
jgi:hypothetical protein